MSFSLKIFTALCKDFLKPDSVFAWQSFCFHHNQLAYSNGQLIKSLDDLIVEKELYDEFPDLVDSNK